GKKEYEEDYSWLHCQNGTAQRGVARTWKVALQGMDGPAVRDCREGGDYACSTLLAITAVTQNSWARIKASVGTAI
ncbi:MAG: hypothetical protein O6933_01005, partial [Planctomycetota bacterium]|nr:hypothetical protein [Planctomycetota bacterium]